VSLIFGRRRDKPTGERAIAFPSLASIAPRGYADVDLSRAEASMQSIAVRSSIDLIASLSSELPIHVYSGKGRERTEYPVPEYLRDPAGDGYGLEDWIYQLLESWLLRGNAYGNTLARARAGYPTQVDWQHPDSVSAHLEDGEPKWIVSGSPMPSSQMWHRRVNPVPGQLLGLSPVAFHAATIGLSLTATQFGLQWFQDGGHPSSLLTNSMADLSPEQSRSAKDLFMAALRGNREPLVLGRGWDWKSIQLAPEESQFLETQGLSSAECARIFGPGMAEILGYESGGGLTYANVESRMQHLLTLAVNKWFRRVERVLSAMLPSPRYARLDRDAILQSTTLDRYRAHASALQNQWRVPNEVREDEDMPPVAWGNQPIIRPGRTPGEPGDNQPDDDQPAAAGGN
jgi:HK97 family phage portal protein